MRQDNQDNQSLGQSFNLNCRGMKLMLGFMTCSYLVR